MREINLKRMQNNVKRDWSGVPEYQDLAGVTGSNWAAKKSKNVEKLACSMKRERFTFPVSLRLT